jgi:hypothetical protein
MSAMNLRNRLARLEAAHESGRVSIPSLGLEFPGRPSMVIIDQPNGSPDVVLCDDGKGYPVRDGSAVLAALHAMGLPSQGLRGIELDALIGRSAGLPYPVKVYKGFDFDRV